ncbi:MAG: gamma-glutamyl-gamma-aminobutyrate hydrolase family protein [Pseudomonadota bacterium]
MLTQCDAPKRKPVLIILHQENSSPGRLGHWLTNQGWPLHVKRPRFGCTLPETLAGYSGVIVFGGPMSANDPEAYLRAEMRLIEQALREDVPLFGVCLGAQMLVNVLGGATGPRADDLFEIGYHPLQATAAGAQMCAWPPVVYQWHREGMTLPAGLTALASTDAYPNQAFATGNAFAVQFHPEITYHLVNRWTVLAADRLSNPGAQPRAAQLASHTRHAPRVGDWLDEIMPRWLAGTLDTKTPATTAATAQPATVTPCSVGTAQRQLQDQQHTQPNAA